jgi:hypothetical protein
MRSACADNILAVRTRGYVDHHVSCSPNRICIDRRRHNAVPERRNAQTSGVDGGRGAGFVWQYPHLDDTDRALNSELSQADCRACVEFLAEFLWLGSLPRLTGLQGQA